MTDNQYQEERRRSERRKLPRSPGGGGHVNKSVKNSEKKTLEKKENYFSERVACPVNQPV